MNRFQKLADQWRHEAGEYGKLIERARAAGTPLGELISTRTSLLICANQLSKEVQLDEADKIAGTDKAVSHACRFIDRYMENHR